MKLDTFADIDFPDFLVVTNGFPFGRYFRLYVNVLIDPGQGIVDVLCPYMNTFIRVLGGLQTLMFRIAR